MAIFKSKKNGLLYILTMGVRGWLGDGPILAIPYNRGIQAADKIHTKQRNVPMNRGVKFKDFVKVGVV